jgi:alpha-1,6-mannosyltransferase
MTRTDSCSPVIPGPSEARSPESITTDRGYGFRARPFGPSRNDREEVNWIRYHWLRLAALGALTTLLTLATPFAFRAWGDNGYMALAIPTGFVAIVAMRVSERTPMRHALVLIFGVAVALRLVLLFIEPLLSTDIYRYVWDGRVQGAGINPYRFVPADAALSALRDEAIYPQIQRADYAVTIYPPVAQYFFFLVARVSETVTAMKLALLACEAVTISIVYLLLQHLQKPVTHIVAYLWHPLPMWEIANSGHVDALMIALMMLGLWLAIRARPLRGAAIIALGALVKPFALLALPPLWRLWDWKTPFVVIAVLAVCYLPYLSVGAGVLGFLTTGYLQEESLVSGATIWPLAAWRTIFGTVHGDVLAYWSVALLVVGGISLMASAREPRTAETTIADVNRLLLAALLLISPNYPWYFLMVTPFVALHGGAPVWTASIGALLLQEEAGWGEHVSILVRKSVLYGAFIVACAFSIRTWRAHGRDKRRPA